MDGLRLPPLIEEVLDSCGQPKDDMYERTQDGGLGEEAAGVEELRLRLVELLMELEETQQDSRRHKENFLEMRTMLEDERAARARQAEAFSRQIEALKVDLVGARQELAVAEHEKQCELEEARAELRWAAEAALELQEAGEEAAAERENDIACLQEELCRLRVQLQRLRDEAGQHEAEVATLRTESGGDRASLEEEFASLSREHLLLSDANRDLSSKVRQEEQEQPGHMTEDDAYISLCRPAPSLPDVGDLQMQLQRAQDSGLQVQTERERVKRSLSSLQALHDDSRHECAALEEELRRCKAELRRLRGEKTQVRGDAGGWNLVPVAVMVAAILVLVVPSLTRA
ncbi:coiled-coil domain-containing protein 136-like isoform X2 [Hippocampus comes]|uniref:coiled-coil domain-containing protein 136-like isoform X2 n=1 Tax=Hippocampus comes TaxID=109280 RepID=UPI00094E9D21|nr:PREDICTED: coiled-coil domain-containing protein 136-like isoform X2 [Hippocampus comes]